jgi:acetyl esterase
MIKRTLTFVVLLAALNTNAQTQSIKATIDAGQAGSPISKRIYGQFIEHIAGIINTGIWAEMLEDRKWPHPRHSLDKNVIGRQQRDTLICSSLHRTKRIPGGDMALDLQARAILDQMAGMGNPPVNELSVSEARQGSVAMAAMQGPPEPVAGVEDRKLSGPGGDLPVRIYMPFGEGPFAVLMYFHGGGWVIGDIESSDGLCRSLANAAGCIVVSVDYRLAPEHPFPAAVDDAFHATLWAAANASSFGGDPLRIAVCGDSAGGNLAAVVAQIARDRGEPAIRFQLLIYPVTDAACDTPSYSENAEGYFLTREAMHWFWNHYVQKEADRSHPYASPLRAGNLADLPAALVITAEYDPLRDEGERYAERMRAAGTPVQLRRFDGMIHGFFTMGAVIDQGRIAIQQSAAALRTAFELRQTK